MQLELFSVQLHRQMAIGIRGKRGVAKDIAAVFGLSHDLNALAVDGHVETGRRRHGQGGFSIFPKRIQYQLRLSPIVNNFQMRDVIANDHHFTSMRTGGFVVMRCGCGRRRLLLRTAGDQNRQEAEREEDEVDFHFFLSFGGFHSIYNAGFSEERDRCRFRSAARRPKVAKSAGRTIKSKSVHDIRPPMMTVATG